MDEPEQWRWIWLGAAVLFGMGEMATPGAFFLAPFGVGAGVAAILAFAGVGITWEWAAFVVISVVAFAAMRPLAKRLDREHGAEGIGSRRLIGRTGTVIEEIGSGAPGLVRVDAEEWRAEAADGSAIALGETVRIAEVSGTRVIVTHTKEHSS